MMPPQMMKGIEPPSRKVAPGQGRGAHRSQPAGAPTTTPRGPAAVQLTSGLSLGEKAVQPVSISLVSTPPTSPPAPCGDTSERTLEPLDEPPYSPQSRGYASEKPRSPVHAVTFRTMVVVLALTGLLGSAIGGATTGVVTALESNFDLSTTQLGIVVVSYDVGAVLTAAPAGYFGMNHAPVWVGSGMLVAAACVVLFGVFSDLWLFILTQIGAGCGASVIWILGCVHIDNNVDNKAVVNAYTGWLMALAPLGIITGLMLVGFFLSDCSDASEGANDCAEVSTATGPPENCSGWRYPFVVLGCCLAPFGLWLLLSRKYYKSPKNATICSKIDYLEEDEWSRHEAEALSFGDFKKGMAHLACNGRYWLLIIGCAVHTFQSGAIIAFGPRFIEKQLCVERSNATLLTATLIPVVSIGVFLGGYIPRRFNWEVGSIRKTILFMGLTTLASSPFAVAAFMVDDVGPFLGFVMVSLVSCRSYSLPSGCDVS
ncbi:hypothetical protein DIPPA_24810 [Diplonema papillatum]|nr:hypothetical protein DIPPA_24810 [Diplonema papillatum]